jgi:hypothetical protein
MVPAKMQGQQQDEDFQNGHRPVSTGSRFHCVGKKPARLRRSGFWFVRQTTRMTSLA